MRRWSGYIPIVSVVGLGAVTWFIAARLGVPVWALTLPACAGGYFFSRTLLRRIHAQDQ